MKKTSKNDNEIIIKKNRKKFWLYGLAVFFIIILASLGLLWHLTLGQIKTSKSSEPEDINKIGQAVKKAEKKEQEQVEKKQQTKKEEPEKVPYNKKITNILLIGIDARSSKVKVSNSDVMMILTINQEENKIKLSSIQRDLLVYVPARQGHFKLNSVMFAGPNSLMEVLNANYALNLQKYIVVNLEAAEKIVDLLGGIEFNVPENPKLIDYWNDVIDRTNKDLEGEPTPLIKGPGPVLLNGRQAITYARLRKLDSDFVRMARQQEILAILFKKLKQASPIQMLKILNTAFSYLSTNLEQLEITGIITSVLPNLSNDIERLSIPIDGYYKGISVDGTYYTAQRLYDQIPIIQRFIFGKFIKNPSVPEYFPTENVIESEKYREEKEKKAKEVEDDNTDESSSSNEDTASDENHTDEG